MDLIDNLLLEFMPRLVLGELKESHEQVTQRTAARLQRLEKDNYQLKLQVGLLIRLLIERGVFSAGDFTKLVEQTEAQLRASGRRKVKARAATAANRGGSPPATGR